VSIHFGPRTLRTFRTPFCGCLGTCVGKNFIISGFRLGDRVRVRISIRVRVRVSTRLSVLGPTCPRSELSVLTKAIRTRLLRENKRLYPGIAPSGGY